MSKIQITKPIISVVSPVYKGEKMVQQLVDRNVMVLTKMVQEGAIGDYELILVNDDSPDQSWVEIVSACQQNIRVKGVNLSRNFGQQLAITAGLSKVKGDWIVVMDCDLQDRPEEIPSMFAKAQEGFDIVYAQRVERKDGFFKKMSSQMFHAVYNWLTDTKSDKTVGNFGIYKRCVIDEYNKLPEQARDFQLLIAQLGFKTAAIPVVHSERAIGSSSYSLGKLLKLTFNVLISCSNKPLKLSIYLGSIVALASMLLAIYNIIARAIGIITVEGYTTTIFSIWFMGGMIMAQLGMIGIYLGKVFNQVKGRPLFIIRDKINIDE